MGREKRAAPGVGTGDHAKERHKRDRRGNLIDWAAPLPPGLVARPDRPLVSSKHKSWFEFIENKDRKKKLEFEFTERREPPPGFEFVPIGNPALTTACKELSRERGAMIFIVTSSSHGFSKRLSLHLNRVGHHIRQTIFEEARASLGDAQLDLNGAAHGLPEPIPERQEEINKQADAAIRDLFPRIPNTDRQMIIEHAFNKSKRGPKGDPPVGLAPDIALSRRVALAVLAHIRHNHTRYDHLLRETSYVNARKAVESLCLDILVKWRGDEETGRDQLDEILCEVIVISDSESDESDDDDEEDSSSVVSSVDESPLGLDSGGDRPSGATVPPVDAPVALATCSNSRGEGLPRANHAPQRVQKVSSRDRRAAKWAQRGFHRYQAARDQAWHQALERQRLGDNQPLQAVDSPAMDMSSSHGPQRWRSPEPGRLEQRSVAARGPPGPLYSSHLSYAHPVPSVDVSREREHRVGEPQHTVSGTAYHGSHDARAAQYQPNDAHRPIVGSRAPPYGLPEVERISYQGQDLKDYLVPSIEPVSPGSSNFATRFPAQPRRPEPGLPHGSERPARVGAQYPPSTRPEPTAAAAGPRPAYAEEGFIRLPPRTDPSRMPATQGQRIERLVAPITQPFSAARGSAAAVASIDLEPQRASAWQDVTARRGGDPTLRPGSQPVWVGHDGAILRSESRPIIIPDYPLPPRQSRADLTHITLDHRRPSPTTWTGDPRQAGHIRADGRDLRPTNATIDQRIESLPDDFVEIVRVSNKFPRQHEPRPASASGRRYDLRSAAPAQPHDDFARYDARPPPLQGQQIERVMGTAARPVFIDENAPPIARQVEGRPRQERVVGIEYVQARPGVETRPYPDRVPFYDIGGDVYQSRSASALPVPYPDVPHQSQAARPVPRRDGGQAFD